MIVGVDEVGRGAWAGPLVVGAVCLNGAEIKGLTDSKKLTPKRRVVLAREIRDSGAAIGLGWIAAGTIDKIGLSKALKLAAELALKEITIGYEQIIIDGTVKLVDDPRVSVMKKADLLVPSVSAASIIAKVARDYYMSVKAHELFPHYGFDGHVGYGTSAHLAALETHGICELHRQSFRPMQDIIGGATIQPKKILAPTEGSKAEDSATQFLKKKGYEIITRNWKNKWCEIDIVAQREGIITFVEVKHRAKNKAGDGLEAITKKKLEQMKFAARIWCQAEKFSGNICLGVIATSGTPPEVAEWLSSVT